MGKSIFKVDVSCRWSDMPQVNGNRTSLPFILLGMMSLHQLSTFVPLTIHNIIHPKMSGTHDSWLKNRMQLNVRQSSTNWPVQRKCNRHWPNREFWAASSKIPLRSKLYRTFSRESIRWTITRKVVMVWRWLWRIPKGISGKSKFFDVTSDFGT